MYILGRGHWGRPGGRLGGEEGGTTADFSPQLLLPPGS